MEEIPAYFQWLFCCLMITAVVRTLAVLNMVAKVDHLSLIFRQYPKGISAQARDNHSIGLYLFASENVGFINELKGLKIRGSKGKDVRHKQNDDSITEAIFRLLEKERNEIGMELHDNVNQLLVGTKLLLEIIRAKPPKTAEFLDECINNIESAMAANRKIAHRLVAPDQEIEHLLEQIERLSKSMLSQAGIKTITLAKSFEENFLTSDQKLAVYRILQEQFINIIKHANAKTVAIFLNLDNNNFYMKIVDDGTGVCKSAPFDGIGLRNIAGRLKILNGTLKIDTDLGDGFMLRVCFPLKS